MDPAIRPRLRDHAVHFFDTFADEYEAWAGGLHGRVARRLVELAAPVAGTSVLDVGTGTGLVANLAAEAVGPSGSVIGVDVSEAMMRVARGRAAANTEFMWMSADHLVFREASFDLVTYSNVLGYLEDPLVSLREALRVLRPGGRVTVSVRRRSLNTSAQQIFFVLLDELTREHPLTIPRPADHRAYLGETEVVRTLLDEAGFASVTTTSMVTGARMLDKFAWVKMMEGAGPRPYSLIRTMGPAMRRRLEDLVEIEMEELGEGGFHYHEAFTFGFGVKPD